jgi:predicted ester cyclase
MPTMQLSWRLGSDGLHGILAGIEPTGNRMEVQSVLISVFEGDDLICEKVYFDHATILRQLGMAG